MQLAHKAHENYVAVVGQVQSDVGKLQEYVASNAAALQRKMEDHWVRMCSDLGLVMDERVVKARESQVQDASVVAGSYNESWNNRLNRLRQLVREPARTSDVQVEKYGTGSRAGSRPDTPRVSPGNLGDEAGGGPSNS